MDFAFNLSWEQAEPLARTGKLIRRWGWTDRWLFVLRGLWFIQTSDRVRVVQSRDFGHADFLADDWTTMWTDQGTCVPGENFPEPDPEPTPAKPWIIYLDWRINVRLGNLGSLRDWYLSGGIMYVWLRDSTTGVITRVPGFYPMNVPLVGRISVFTSMADPAGGRRLVPGGISRSPIAVTSAELQVPYDSSLVYEIVSTPVGIDQHVLNYSEIGKGRRIFLCIPERGTIGASITAVCVR